MADGTTAISTETVADLYLRQLAHAGTDFAPVIETYAKASAANLPVPRPVTVPHENIAVAMAIGYYLGSGRPQSVMVHVTVGTANALMGLMNACRGNIPMLLTAGRTPMTERERRILEADRRALEILGLEGRPAAADIKAAYKSLVKKHHPDANGGDRSSEDRLRAIINAYNHLKQKGFV